MAKFLKGNELNAELEKIFENAETQIFLISPYIKLHDRYSATLLTKLNNPELEITILFGKNEADISKSMNQNDFDFFKQFPNIEILYEKRLHAKYYANERKALLTSMNLYGFSQNNNIEVGILMDRSKGDHDIDEKSWNYFTKVLEQSEQLYWKRPIFEKKGFFSATKYIKSEVVVDNLSNFFNDKQYTKVQNKKKEYVQKTKTQDIGYCIRTGVEIPFNVKKPMIYEAFKMWNKYKDADYPEKYCHFSGDVSKGKTSVNKPILKENWKAAKEKYNL